MGVMASAVVLTTIVTTSVLTMKDSVNNNGTVNQTCDFGPGICPMEIGKYCPKLSSQFTAIQNDIDYVETLSISSQKF